MRLFFLLASLASLTTFLITNHGHVTPTDYVNRESSMIIARPEPQLAIESRKDSR